MVRWRLIQFNTMMSMTNSLKDASCYSSCPRIIYFSNIYIYTYSLSYFLKFKTHDSSLLFQYSKNDSLILLWHENCVIHHPSDCWIFMVARVLLQLKKTRDWVLHPALCEQDSNHVYYVKNMKI